MHLQFYVFSKVQNNHLSQRIYADRDKLRLWMTPQEIYFDFDDHQSKNPNNPTNYAEGFEKLPHAMVNVNKLSIDQVPSFIDDQPFTLDGRTKNTLITVNRLYHFPFDRIETKLFNSLYAAEQYLVAHYYQKCHPENVSAEVEQQRVDAHQQILEITYHETSQNQEKVTQDRFIINRVPIIDIKHHDELGLNNLFH